MDKAWGTFIKYIIKHRLALLGLTILTIIAFCLRAKYALHSPFLTYFSSDDHGHCFRSGINNPHGTDLLEIFRRSYSDAHPPLRNILLNIVLRNTDDIYNIRLVPLFFGTLLVPLAFFFTKAIYWFVDDKTKHSNLVALSISSIYAFAHSHFILAIETRPYLIMAFFQICAAIALLHFIKYENRNSAILFYCCSALTIFTDYSGLMSIFTLSLVMIAVTLNKNSQLFKYQRLVFIGSVLLFSLASLQLYSMHSYKAEDPKFSVLENNMNLGYIAVSYIENFEDLQKRFVSVFRDFFVTGTGKTSKISKDKALSSLLLSLLYIIGLIWLLIKRSWTLAFLALFPILLGILLSYLRIFPFTGHRHSIYLVCHLLIPYIGIFNFLLHQKRNVLFKLFFVCIAAVFFYYSGIHLSSHEYMETITAKASQYRLSPLKEKDLQEIAHLVSGEKYQNHIIIVHESIKIRLKNFLHFYKFKNYKEKDLISKQLTLIKNRDSLISFSTEGNEARYLTEKEISTKLSKKVLLIIEDAWSSAIAYKDLIRRGFNKETFSVTHKEWSYHELQAN